MVVWAYDVRCTVLLPTQISMLFRTQYWIYFQSKSFCYIVSSSVMQYYCRMSIDVNHLTCLALRQCWSGWCALLRVATLRRWRLEHSVNIGLSGDHWLRLLACLLLHVFKLLDHPVLAAHELDDRLPVMVVGWPSNGIQLLKHVAVWGKTHNEPGVACQRPGLPATNKCTSIISYIKQHINATYF